MLSVLTPGIVPAPVGVTAHVAAAGRGFVLWVLFRLLARAIGWVGAIAVVAAVGLISVLARYWRQR